MSLAIPSIAPTPLGAEARRVLDFERVVRREFDAWVITRPWTDEGQRIFLLDQGECPTGWAIMARRPHPTRPDDMASGLFLMERQSGGWVIVRASVLSNGSTRVVLEWFHLTLAALYEHLSSNFTLPPSGRDVGWIERHLVTMYDPSDEKEAAHQTLVALGAPVRVLPRAAHRFGQA